MTACVLSRTQGQKSHLRYLVWQYAGPGTGILFCSGSPTRNLLQREVVINRHGDRKCLDSAAIRVHLARSITRIVPRLRQVKSGRTCLWGRKLRRIVQV